MIKKIRDYFRNVASELKKVTWARPRELFQTTLVVIMLSIIVSFFIMICDLIFSNVLRLILR
ncbi:MAG: preprotein translocase subunit SecE [candidate division WOR-3 bacterium]|nr:preprotein translocase subunit SecE [candidate division WOR-3 bacterium]MCX7757137.1 preprotein translocase subunit SecE [candidate division WOR-3 bacterium]MDW7987797.1 preprotein translocase subunit SecE [candidate division WOR-3 bacterium]